MAFLFYCVFALWLGGVAGVILCDETCASPDRGNNASVCFQEKDSRQEIALLGLFPCNTPNFQARGLTVAGQMAVRQISYSDNTTHLLSGYRLKLYVENSQCASLPAVRAFIDNLDPQMNRNLHMVLGPGCTSGATVVAPLANAWNLTTVSFTASSPSFSDKTRFPNFLRTISSDIEAFTVQAALITEYGWRQVALLTEFTPLFTDLQEAQVRELSALGIIVYKYQLSEANETLEQRVTEILTSGVRVVIVNTFEQIARELFCEVYRQNNANLNSFVWIVYGWYTETWLDMELPSNCTREMLYAVVDRVLAVDHYPLPTPEEANNATDVAYTPNDFWTAFEEEIENLKYPDTEAISQARYVYDAVWLAAYMFDRGLRRLQEEFGMELEDIDYSSRNFTEILLEESKKISFRGVSGMVRLNENGDRTPSFRVSQWRVNNGSANLQLFASLSGQQLVYMYNQSEATVWPGGVPRDYDEDFVDLWLLIVFGLLSAGGIIFAIICIVFDLLFSKKQLVKVTSPYLNVIIDTGIIFIFLLTIALGIGGQEFLPITPASAFCMVYIWIASIAFTVVFSPLFAKTFRVYWIFSRSKKMAKAKPFKDWILFVIVAVSLILDVVFLTFATAFDSSRLMVVTQLLQRSGGAVPSQIRVCTADQGVVWISILFALKGVFLLSGVFLAIQTWNIKLKRINDSQLIAVSIVAVFFATVVAAMVAFFLRSQVDLAYGITAACAITVGYLLLGLLYLKKMHSLWKHPDGVLEGGVTTSTEVSLAAVSSQANTERTTQLQHEVESLRKQAETLRRRAGLKPSETTVPGSTTPTPSHVKIVENSTIDLVPVS